MNRDYFLSNRTKNIESSVIREILKVVSQPGMVSMAGGIPAPESFPVDIIRDLASVVIDKYGSRAFQYDTTEGFPPLREAIAQHLNTHRGISTDFEDVLIASGSQGVLDALGKVFISKGDKVAVEAPTYLGAIQAFNAYEPMFVNLRTDEDGVVPESLEKILMSENIKLIYLVPTFQNPTGRTIPLERRKAVAEIIKRHDALLIEDDPYSSLRYKGAGLDSIKTFAPENVIYMSTLSKVFAPGLRVGFCVASEWVRRWLVLVKQGTDLHTSTFNQALAAEYISGKHLERHLPKIIEIYRPKQQAMFRALDRHFPHDFKWSKPEGGMFIWAEGPQGLNMDRVFKRAIERQVAFVPGRYFYTSRGVGQETMRLNFTMIDEATIDRSIQTLSEVIREEYAN
jgi:2-aminoadipate transaminase